MKKEISDIVEKQENENRLLKVHLVDLLERVDRLRFTNPFMPFDITLKKEAQYLGKNYWDIKFWHHTNATVIAIKRGSDLLISPGPYALLEEQDIIYFIGNKNAYGLVHSFLYSDKI
ncbi:cation:proton antiporter regulatory subunit [endosymbiont 'TC1' of Trimyema compressum]|uniref:cation:proton antiporter regulatory subunit n=1 Tax=endosymbiont 'TC1' of Trimyema compressum TaxID=243899 RepID=UPI001FDEAB14|nr:TrkA C-terminal domain-containing protein [endosymbiont 'TC1' of Trimyema compressum]